MPLSDAKSIAELRGIRRQLQTEEDAVSFVRRMTQGRVDLVRDEQRRRADGDDTSRTLDERLAEVFGQQHGGGSARPPRSTDVAADHPMLRELDQLCEEYQFAALESLSDRDLGQLLDALELFEKSCSGRRHELFDRIDALTAELVQRLRSDGAGAVGLDG